MLYVLGFIATFVIGGVTGVMFSAIPFDQAGARHLLRRRPPPLRAGRRRGVPDVRGDLPLGAEDDRAACSTSASARSSFWLIFIGFNLNMFPLHILGILGQPRRIYTYEEGLGWDVYNLMSTIGAFILALGVLVIVVNWFRSKRTGELGGRRSVEGRDARVGDDVTAPALQLRDGADRSQPRADVGPSRSWPEGPRPPRTGGYALDRRAHVTLSTSLLDAKPQGDRPHAPRVAVAVLSRRSRCWSCSTDCSWTSLAVTIGRRRSHAVGTLMGWFWPRGRDPGDMSARTPDVAETDAEELAPAARRTAPVRSGGGGWCG